MGKNGESLKKKREHFVFQFMEITDELKFKKDQEDARKKNLRDLGRQLEALQADLANAEETVDIQVCKKNLGDLGRQLEALQGTKFHLSAGNY